MGEAAKKLMEAAVKLPRGDRIHLIERLMATIDGEPEEGAAEAWETEIARRSRQIEKGQVQPIPWTEVKRNAARRARLDDERRLPPHGVQGGCRRASVVR